MTEIEIWIDVLLQGENKREMLCTLFARHAMSEKPQIGESLFFHFSKSQEGFKILSAQGATRCTSVSVEVDEIWHSARTGNGGGVEYQTSIRCSDIVVPSKEDARIICNSMIQHLKFEFDPYGINNLDA